MFPATFRSIYTQHLCLYNIDNPRRENWQSDSTPPQACLTVAVDESFVEYGVRDGDVDSQSQYNKLIKLIN